MAGSGSTQGFCVFSKPDGLHHRRCLVVRLLTQERTNAEGSSKDSWKTQLTKVADSSISAAPAMPFIYGEDKNTDLDYRKSPEKYAMNIHS